MNLDKIAIIMTTYNNEDIIAATLESFLKQEYENLYLIITDDESKDNTPNIIKNYVEKNSKIILIEIPHGERGVGRKIAIEKAYEIEAEYIYILDSDMRLKENLIKECHDYLKKHSDIGALVIPEIPFSNFNNFYSKVKVFERKIINNAGENIGLNSIEAARFWKTSEYKKTGGLNPKQISFEEIQPTIRYLEMNGIIKRATFTGVFHDEKKVTLQNLLSKKKYYFSVMNKTLETENNGFFKALTRWYFFRPVLYRPSNLIEYLKHPLLTLGMILMYLLLTLIALISLIKGK